MVLGAVAAGAGLSALGGLLGHQGVRQQTRAQQRAAQRGRQQLGGIRDEQAASVQQTMDQLTPLDREYAAAFGGLTDEFAGRRGRLPGHVDAATGGLAEARSAIDGMIRPASTHLSGPGGMTHAMVADRHFNRLAQPQTDLRAQGLGRLYLEPERVDAHGRFGTTAAGLQRQGAEHLGDAALRNIQFAGRRGQATGQVETDLQRAQHAGQFMGGLGALASGLAPGVTAAMLPQQQGQSFDAWWANADPTTRGMYMRALGGG